MSRVRSWYPVSRHAEWRYARRAKQDATATPPIPTWDAKDLPPVLRELQEAGSHDADLYAARWESRDDRLLSRWRDAREARRHADTDAAEAEQTLQRASMAYEEWNGEPAGSADGRPLRRYWLIIAVLLLLETPFNGVILSATGGSMLENYAIAGLVTVSIVMLAHFLGVHIRKTKEWTAKRIAGGVSLILAAFGAISAVSYFRSIFISAEQTRIAGFDLDPASALKAFIAVNVLLFVAATTLSFFTHAHGLSELVRARRKVKHTRKAAEKAARLVSDVYTRREKQFDAAKAYLDLLQEAVDIRAERYRITNLRRRNDRQDQPTAYPASFDIPLTIDRPEIFYTGLSWTEHDVSLGTHSLHEPSGDGTVAATSYPGS